MSTQNLTQNSQVDNRIPQHNGQRFIHAESIRIFLHHLDRLNTLARLIQESPIPAERAEQFYLAYWDVTTSVSELERLSWSKAFDSALQALTDSGAWKTAEQKKLAMTEKGGEL